MNAAATTSFFSIFSLLSLYILFRHYYNHIIADIY